MSISTFKLPTRGVIKLFLSSLLSACLGSSLTTSIDASLASSFPITSTASFASSLTLFVITCFSFTSSTLLSEAFNVNSLLPSFKGATLTLKSFISAFSAVKVSVFSCLLYFTSISSLIVSPSSNSS